MIFHKFPPNFRKAAHLAILAAAVGLFAITATAGQHKHKASKDIVETAASNGVIHVTDEVILPD